MIRYSALLVLFMLILTAVHAQDETMRRLVLHQEHATLDIPSDWHFSNEISGWQGESGSFYASNLLEAEALETICSMKAEAINGDVSEMLIAGQAACRISSIDSNVYVISHPSPFPTFNGLVSYIELGGSGINDIIGTLRFNETPSPADYMNSLIDIVEAKSYYSMLLDWQLIRTEAVNRANSEQSYAAGIDYLISQLESVGDRHSNYWTNPGILDSEASINYSPFVSEMEGSNIGYIQLFALSDAGLASTYANELQQNIIELELAGARCWIVDLRANTGGNAASMIMGLSPLLGDGSIVGFVDASGTERNMALNAGQIVDAETGDLSYPNLLEVPYSLSIQNPPIAILQSVQTGSAAEMTLLAFHGRPNVRSFGKPSAGLTIANTVILLYDGPFIALASAATMDSFGNVFESSIIPDEEIPTRANIREAAVSWLNNAMACD